MYNIVYKTTCLINNKIYVGVHKSNKLMDAYIGCGIRSKKYLEYILSKPQKYTSPFTAAVAKYGYDNFIRENIKIFPTYQEALQYEKEIVNKQFVKDPNTYNVNIGGAGHEYSENQRNKIRQRMILNNPMKNEISKQKSVLNRNYTVTDETKQKISEKAKIWCNTPEMKSIRSKNATGENNSSYDPTIYKFVHKTGIIFEGTKLDLKIKENDLNGGNLKLIFKSPTRSWRGWKCQDCGHYSSIPLTKNA